MKKLLLAGGAGFIGSHLVDRLLKRNDLDMLVVVDSLWTGRAQNVDHIRDQRLVLVRSEVEHFKSDFQFDEIFHLASPASPRSDFNPMVTVECFQSRMWCSK